MNKENIKPGPDVALKLCTHAQCNDVEKNICIPCAMTVEDWRSLETLPTEAIRIINAHGLLSFLGFTVIEGELFHESDFMDEPLSDNEQLEET